MVRADRAEEARRLLAEVLVENERPWPEPVDVVYPDETHGRKPRGYGLIGAYARAYLWAIGLMAVAFGIFLLLRGIQ